MNKFKAGDKVETPFGVGIFYGYIDGGFMSGSLRVDYEKVQTGAVYFWNEDDIKPYKTAHEKLIDLGYAHKQLSEDLTDDYYYKGDFDYIWFSRTEKNYTLGDYVYVDIELSRILTQYLEELENDK